MQTHINTPALQLVLNLPLQSIHGFSQGVICSNQPEGAKATRLGIQLADGRRFACRILLASHRQQLKTLADDVLGFPAMFSHEGFGYDGLPINPEFIRLLVGYEGGRHE